MQSRLVPSLVGTIAARSLGSGAACGGSIAARACRADGVACVLPAAPRAPWAAMTPTQSSTCSSAAFRITSRSMTTRSEVAGGDGEVPQYTPDDVALWRANFRFPRRQHSLAQVGYTDDELLAWRVPFDKVSQDGKLSFEDFERLVLSKYAGIVDDNMLYQKVFGFWVKFDKDRSDFIDFGEFMKAGLHFNVDHAKEKIRVEGAGPVFSRYAADGYISEEGILQLMEDYHFFTITTTDMQKVMKVADQDRDGLISSEDFKHWVADPPQATASSLDLPKTMSQHRPLISPKQRRARRPAPAPAP